MPLKINRIVAIGRGSMGSKTHLLSLAPLDWWLSTFFAKEKPNWELATDFLMRQCERSGVFDIENIRGAGAWFDNGRSIFHMGKRLLVDGDVMNIDQLNSRYIYEMGRELDGGLNFSPACEDESKKVISLFQQIKFEKPVSALLAAGWCYLAPICGAMEWRPHVWLIGARGTGKSWIQNNIIYPLIGNVGLKVASSSTEAGIRQSLMKDARPVVFDEAESEDLSSRKRIQNVIELARQASSAGNAQITKGSASGQAMSYSIRSMFLFGSINPAINQASDESRIAVLSLMQHSKELAEIERFNAFEREVNETLTNEFCSSIRARAYRDIPKIRSNAKVMARAVAEHLKSQRIGDQYGALLAGAFGLFSDVELDINTARDWVSKLDFSEARESESVLDEEVLITTLFQAEIRAEIAGIHIVKTLAEILGSLEGNYDLGIPNHELHSAIGRYGFKYDNNNLYVSNKHEKISNMLKNTAWSSNWSRVLLRLNGAEKVPTTLRIGGTPTRCVMIPVSDYL
jgi:putative DNA primase/helicase